MDEEFIKIDEEEQGNEFEEEAGEDYDYLDYDYDDLECKDYDLIREAKITTWVGSDGTTTVEGVEVDWPILGRSKVFNDVCSICFKALTSTGEHQICCLPCGHIYGMSCITQWLQQSYSKCPQCKSVCTLKDVTLLCGTHPSHAVTALPKVSTKRFPLTKQGVKAFKRYARRRLDDDSTMRLDAARRYDYALQQRREIFRRWYYSPAVQQPDKYYRLVNNLINRDAKLNLRMRVLKRRIKVYHASIAEVQRVYDNKVFTASWMMRKRIKSNNVPVNISS